MAAEDIDAVFTWVDGADPEFRRALGACTANGTHRREAIGAHRFRDSGELRYALRSAECFAPWIRRIFIVTNGQVPPWLDTAHERITIVRHDEIFSDPRTLPTFNSNAIELQLHRIPGLSRRFLYLNDDVFLGQPATPADFVVSENGQRVYFERIALERATGGARVHDRAYAATEQIVERHFGRAILDLLPAHVPQLYDKSLLADLERLFDEEFRRTSANRIRSEDDLVLRILYFSFLLGRDGEAGRHRTTALQWGSADYTFLSLDDRLFGVWRSLLHIRRQRPRFFCINDDLGDVARARPVLTSVRAFLRLYFPRRAAFEKPANNPTELLPPARRPT